MTISRAISCIARNEIENAARARLESLTTELGLTAAQRDKMFPELVRATPGYVPAMLVGSPSIASTTASAEAIHQVLDPQQQALVEDQEVNRQLWWQDTLARLEAGLIPPAGEVPVASTPTPPAPEQTTPPATERVAPAARDNGNLLDLPEPDR